MKQVKNLIEQATRVRDTRHKSGEKFDVIAAMEYGIPWKFPTFSFDIVSRENWEGGEDEDAYVEFSPEPHLCILENIYDGARHGDHSCRFTLAHELAHIYLHSKTAARRLARRANKLASRTNEKQEREANIFAGALLIHYPSIKLTTDPWELKLAYVVSNEVARRAKRQKFFGKFS